MKVSIILFVVISAAAGLAQLPTTCPENPFQRLLKKNKVSIFSQPKSYQGSSCGAEWATFGVCCDDSALLSFAKKDTQDIMEAVDSVVSFLEKFNSLHKAFQRYAKTRHVSEMALFPKRKALIEFFRGTQSEEFGKQLDELIIGQKLEASLKDCWTKIAISRSGALCSVCSGRSDRFFVGQKILMVDSDCGSILQECLPALNNVVVALELSSKYFQQLLAFNIQHCKLLGSLVIYFKSVGFLKDLVKKIEQEQIHKTIAKYLKLQGDFKLKPAVVLCSKFLNIQGQTFVEKIKVILSDSFLNLERFAKTIDDNLGQTLKWKKASFGQHSFSVQGRDAGSRLLHQFSNANQNQVPIHPQSQLEGELVGIPNLPNLPDLESLFISDVSVVPLKVDMPYTSDSGANGTKHINSIPYNMSQVFP